MIRSLAALTLMGVAAFATGYGLAALALDAMPWVERRYPHRRTPRDFARRRMDLLREEYLPNVAPLAPWDKRRLLAFRDQIPVEPV